MPDFDVLSCVDATELALANAPHLSEMDAGAVAALRELARKIDAWDVIVGWALDDLAGNKRPGERPKVPEHDNVSLPTYLKYCEALGLSPQGRFKLNMQKKEPAGGGKLHSLQAAQAKRRRRTASA